mgnify:CR=1 FL=1
MPLMLSDDACDFGATALGCGSDVYAKQSAWTVDPEDLNVGDELMPLGKLDVYDVLGAMSCVVSKLENTNLYQVTFGFDGAVVPALSPEKPETPLKRAPEAQPTPRTEPMMRMARSPGEAYAAEATLCLGPSPTKRYRCKDPELLVSSMQRLHGKTSGPVLVTMKRNARL